MPLWHLREPARNPAIIRRGQALPSIPSQPWGRSLSWSASTGLTLRASTPRPWVPPLLDKNTARNAWTEDETLIGYLDGAATAECETGCLDAEDDDSDGRRRADTGLLARAGPLQALKAACDMGLVLTCSRSVTGRKFVLRSPHLANGKGDA